MTSAEEYALDVKTLIDEDGERGVLACSGTHTYDPATGNTAPAAPEIDVMFVVVSTSTMVDIEPNRRAIQRDTGLDKLAEGRILFYLAEGETNKPSETGSVTSIYGVVYTFADLRPFLVQGKVVAYSATHRGVRDGL